MMKKEYITSLNFCYIEYGENIQGGKKVVKRTIKFGCAFICVSIIFFIYFVFFHFHDSSFETNQIRDYQLFNTYTKDILDQFFKNFFPKEIDQNNMIIEAYKYVFADIKFGDPGFLIYSKVKFTTQEMFLHEIERLSDSLQESIASNEKTYIFNIGTKEIIEYINEKLDEVTLDGCVYPISFCICDNENYTIEYYVIYFSDPSTNIDSYIIDDLKMILSVCKNAQ